MAKPITNRVKMGKTPVIRKDLEGGVIAEANNDGSIYVDKSVKKGSPLEKEAIAHEKVHLNQMKRGDLNYDDNNVYWKGKAYSRSSMNEGAKNLPWEKEAYDKTKHMNKSKSKSPAKMSDADLVANNPQVHSKFSGGNDSFQKYLKKSTKEYFKKPGEKDKSQEEENNLDDNNSPVPMKATPITLKSRRGYDSPLNYNSPLKEKGKSVAADEYKDEEGKKNQSKESGTKVEYVKGADGRVYKKTVKTTVSKGSSESSSKPTPTPSSSKGNLPTYVEAWDKNLENIRNKYNSYDDYVADLQSQKRNKNKADTGGESSSGSKESSSEEVSYDKVMVTKKGDPGTYNPGFWLARNTEKSRQQQEKTGDAIKREAKRDLIKKYRKSGRDLPGKRRGLYVDPNNPTEFMSTDTDEGFKSRLKAEAEFDKQHKKSYHPLNKIHSATADKQVQASAEGEYSNVKLDESAGLSSSSSKSSESSSEKNNKKDPNAPVKMKANSAFKMKGWSGRQH